MERLPIGEPDLATFTRKQLCFWKIGDVSKRQRYFVPIALLLAAAEPLSVVWRVLGALVTIVLLFSFVVNALAFGFGLLQLPVRLASLAVPSLRSKPAPRIDLWDFALQCAIFADLALDLFLVYALGARSNWWGLGSLWG